MNSYERGKALLEKLGTPADRPARPVRDPSNGPCKRCGVYCVVWATLPSGSRVPLDRHPAGPIVIRNGLAVEMEAHDDEARFIMHFANCKKGGA